MDTFSAIAVLGLVIGVCALLLEVAGKIWKASDSLLFRISLLVQIATLLALFYMVLRFIGQ